MEGPYRQGEPASHSGKNIYPDEGLGYLDMEVGLFQTEKGATVKNPAQPGGARDILT